MRHAIFLEGPIGTGKTTLGRLLAQRLQVSFVDGDDHHVMGRSWFGSALTTSRGILNAGLSGIETHGKVVIAYPLRCVNWVYYKTHFTRAGVATIFVSLHASIEDIAAQGRGRALGDWELARSCEMSTEGYGSRPFSDLRIATGGRSVVSSLAELEASVRRFAGLPC